MAEIDHGTSPYNSNAVPEPTAREYALEQMEEQYVEEIERESAWLRTLKQPYSPSRLLLPTLCALFAEHGDEIIERYVPLLAERALEHQEDI